MNKIQLPLAKQRFIIGSYFNNAKEYLVFMEPLSTTNEARLDRGESIKLENCKCNIDRANTYIYGELNISSDEDVSLIEDINISFEDNRGIVIPANYNLESHSCLSDDKNIKHRQTFSLFNIFEYGYGCIGKPKAIIIACVPKLHLENVYPKLRNHELN